MIRFIILPRCSIKRATVYMICIILVGLILHFWLLKDVVKLADSIKSFFTFHNKYSLYLNKYRHMKYILMWKSYYLIISPNGENIFPYLNCPVRNCMFTADKNFLGDYSLFDAILFDNELSSQDKIKPVKRRNSQLYIFTTIESSYSLPMCEVTSDDFFNWTATYRLDSDVPWLYFVVKDVNGTVVGPSTTVEWQRSLDPVKPELKAILDAKTKTAAWLVSHCKSDSFRDDYLSRLQEHLMNYGLKIDVYGACANHHCPNDDCNGMIKRKYMFYMAFENSFAKDYVSEKVLHAYNNYAIPIVYGGANYSRFLPSGSYINARKMHPYNLAHLIRRIVESRELFESYFKYTNLYTVTGDAKDYHPLCELCEALNSERAVYAPARKNFRIWWNGQNGMKWCLSQEYWNETAKVNLDGSHVFKIY